MNKDRISDPHSEEAFEHFLREAGLSLLTRRGPDGEPFGNWIIQYGNKDLEVSIVSDRSDRNVRIADKNTVRPRWPFPPASTAYDVSGIRELLDGGVQESMDLTDQEAYVRNNWARIVHLFAAEHRQATHERLTFLGRERLKRVLPVWPTAILQFEEFLQGLGMKCSSREAPDGALDERLMQYDGKTVSVRMDSKDGWQLLLSDRSSQPGDWYSIHAIRRLLFPEADSALPFLEWFTFAQHEWDRIVALFEPSKRDESHKRLKPLREDTLKRRHLAREKQIALMQKIADKLGQGRDPLS